jgi:TetR/AcrR family transcriptional regulator, regulator of cefoperazone and chloramphenicol sensitivity
LSTSWWRRGPSSVNDWSLVAADADLPVDTRSRLAIAAAHLFARHGVDATPLRDVVALAGQRNASAVQYHFGGRRGLVAAVLARHADAVVGGDDAYEGASVDEVVEALVRLLRPKLATEEGRDFLRIVFELMQQYPGRWDTADVHRGLTRLIDRVEVLLRPLPRQLARNRAVAMTQFVTHQFAERARRVDDGHRGLVPEPAFTRELTAMAVALLTAPERKHDP